VLQDRRKSADHRHLDVITVKYFKFRDGLKQTGEKKRGGGGRRGLGRGRKRYHKKNRAKPTIRPDLSAAWEGLNKKKMRVDTGAIQRDPGGLQRKREEKL